MAALLAAPFLVVAGCLVVLPVVQLLLSATDGVGASGMVEILTSRANLRAVRVTFVVSGVVTMLSLAVGGVIAWVVRFGRRRWLRITLLVAVFVPLCLGSVVKLYAWTILLQTYGPVNDLLLGLGLADHRLGLLYNAAAVTVGMVYQMIPYSVVPLLVAFRQVDEDLLMASEGLGASRLCAIRTVALPIAAPGIAAAATLVFVISSGFYLTPVLLGGLSAPFSASLISSSVFEFHDMPGAASQSVLILAADLVLLGAARLFLGAGAMRRAVA